jgi:hypothetical protein
MPVTSSSNWTHPARFRTATVGLSFFKDLIYIPKIQLTTEKKGQGMAKAKSKNPVGRPRFKITPEVLEAAEQFMAQGLTREQCAANLGISRSTFQLYQAEYSEFSDTIKKGEARGIGAVTNALFENATVNKDNVAIIFYLKNRAGWVDKKEVATTVEQKHVIDITRISDDQLSAIATIFEQPNAGAGQGRKVPQIIEGVYESSMADD